MSPFSGSEKSGNVSDIPVGTYSREQIDGLVRKHRTYNLMFAALTLVGSILTGVYIAGKMMGEMRADIANLAKSYNNLAMQVATLNASTNSLNSSITALQIEAEDFKTAMENERQDRLDEEQRFTQFETNHNK